MSEEPIKNDISPVENEAQISEITEGEYYKTEKDLARIVEVFEQIGFRDFVNYLHSPWTIIKRNFLAGIARGLGILIGMTVVATGLVWIVTQLVDFPLIGQYFELLLKLLENIVPEPL